MVRKSSSLASETPAAPVAETVAPAPIVDAPAPKAKAPKKSKAASAPLPAVEESALASSVAVPEPVPEVAVKSEPEPSAAAEEAPAVAGPIVEKIDIAVRCTELNAQVQFVATQLATIRTNLKQLEKQFLKEIKTLSKGKKNKNAGTKRPNSFQTPRPIHDELADFMGVERGSSVSLIQVNKFINSYISEHKLKNPENGRVILPDEKLATLLKIGPDDELKFFNLQRFLKPLYIKKAAPVAAV
jgi:chromatin remodeling complex protein RSC6